MWEREIKVAKERRSSRDVQRVESGAIEVKLGHRACLVPSLAVQLIAACWKVSDSSSHAGQMVGSSR